MYAYDFLTNGVINSDKVFLSGDNECIKDLVIQKVTSLWGATERIYATKNTDLRVSSNQLIFGNTSKVVYIISGKAEPNKTLHHVVKLSSSPISKKYKGMGFEEIVCSSFFPNQIENFCKLFIREQKVNISPVYGKFLCVTCGYDLVSVINIIKVLSYLDQTYVGSLSYADFSLLCGTLTITDEMVITNYFLEGNYTDFLSRLQDNPRIISPVVRNLLYTLLKAKSNIGMEKPTWYQKKLLSYLVNLEHYGVDKVILELQAIVDDHEIKFPQLMLRLHRLVKVIRV